jgi:hypothetical protein
MVSALIEPKCLEGSRLSVIASGGWMGSYSSVASLPAYFLSDQDRFDRQLQDLQDDCSTPGMFLQVSSVSATMKGRTSRKSVTS